MSKIRVMVVTGIRDSWAGDGVVAAVVDAAETGEFEFVGQEFGDLKTLSGLLQPPHGVNGSVTGDHRVRNSRADVVLLVAQDGNQVPGVCSHLLAEFPNLVVLTIPATGASGLAYRRLLCGTPAVVHPAADLLRTIRESHDD